MKQLYMNYRGIGDALLLSTVLFHLGRQNSQSVILGTNHPEIYRGNSYVRLMPFKTQRINHQIALLLERSGIAGPMKYLDYYRGINPRKHILALLAEEVGLCIPPLEPLLFLTDKERAAVLPESTKPWLAIQSTGLETWTENKNWGAFKFDAVAKIIGRRYSLVQLGAAGDPALGVDLNLCGKIQPRQAAALLGSCAGFIGQVGYLMHAAAAMKVPSVIIYGGFEAPWQSGYAQNINIYNPVPCAPCWLAASCPHDRACLEAITVDGVVDALARLMAKQVRGAHHHHNDLADHAKIQHHYSTP